MNDHHDCSTQTFFKILNATDLQKSKISDTAGVYEATVIFCVIFRLDNYWVIPSLKNTFSMLQHCNKKLSVERQLASVTSIA